jgi:hypothetical protein
MFAVLELFVLELTAVVLFMLLLRRGTLNNCLRDVSSLTGKLFSVPASHVFLA